MSDVGILIIDDDSASQNALKSLLDSEGWRVRNVKDASESLAALATGDWDLVIANVAVASIGGPLFAILRELSDTAAPSSEGAAGNSRKQLRALFLVPLRLAAAAQPVLEGEGLAYSLKPHHLHEFFEKISDLLVDSGVIEAPIRTLGAPIRKISSQFRRQPRHSQGNAMFASREDYQMTEEEMIEYERQEEEDRKKKGGGPKDDRKL